MLFHFFKHSENYPIVQQPGTLPTKEQQAHAQYWFGMFLHFGINTFHNTDWSDGSLPTDSYRPETIDTDQWVKTALQAGMQYVILTAKHHDGFCLWDTDTTEYGIRHSANTTDVVATLAASCRKYGVKMGLYYSLWDRHEPCYSDDRAYVDYMERQLKELLDGQYGEVIELWLDGGWDKRCEDWQLNRLYSLVKTMQPGCQFGVNLTIGKYNHKKGNPSKRYLPERQRKNDPIRMFPSDFRLWDPYMCAENDPKVFTFQGRQYYLPFEHTICSRQSGKWFYSDAYENGALIDAAETVHKMKILKNNQNRMVINLPPDRSGRLILSDQENLFQIAQLANLYQGGNIV